MPSKQAAARIETTRRVIDLEFMDVMVGTGCCCGKDLLVEGTWLF
jgi:hypothetical protein